MNEFIEQIYKKNKNYHGLIFLDRDGTLNYEVGYLSKLNQIKILPSVVKGLDFLNKNKIAVIVIANQPVVARGYVSVEGLKKINDRLTEILGKKNVYIDAIYSCPHHPEKNHRDIPAFAKKFRVKCKCRKPGLAMLERAFSAYKTKKIIGIVGDQTRDIMCGKNFSIKTALVLTGHKGQDGVYKIKPDFVGRNFYDAVKKLF